MPGSIAAAASATPASQQPQEGDIVVTGRRLARDGAAATSGTIRQVAQQVAAQANGERRDDPTLRAFPVTEVGLALDRATLATRYNNYRTARANAVGRFDPYDDARVEEAFAANARFLDLLDSIVAAREQAALREFGSAYLQAGEYVPIPVVAGIATAVRVATGDETIKQAAFNIVAGKVAAFGGKVVIATGAKALGTVAAASRSAAAGVVTVESVEAGVLFGQRRVGQNFGVEGRPDYLAGRSITDVANDLRSGVLRAVQLPIDAFRVGNNLVSANTRSLAALSEAGLSPTIINEIQPTTTLLQRFSERPVIANAPLPGPRVPVTPTQRNLNVLRVIELPR